MTTFDINFLEEKANVLRQDVIEMLHTAKSGHPGGALSSADIMAVLFFGGFVSAQGPKNTGKITFDEKAELVKKMQMDYVSNEFGLFESLMVDTVAVYLGSSNKATKEELIQG